MREHIQIEKVFDQVLVSLTRVLAGVELTHAEPVSWGKKDTLVETIYTNGNFDSFILLEMESELFEYIVAMMNGGDPPGEEEKTLYMNEYINIICGRAISMINNELGNTSRLSVPTFHGASLKTSGEQQGKEQTVLFYGTEKGYMKLRIYYTFQ